MQRRLDRMLPVNLVVGVGLSASMLATAALPGRLGDLFRDDLADSVQQETLESVTDVATDESADAIEQLVPQEVGFKALDHDIVVRGSTLSRKRIRRRLKRFRHAVRAIESRGWRVGVVIRDLDTGASLTYDADKTFHPASCVKGPYAICVCRDLVEEGKTRARTVLRLAEPTIVASDNEAYLELRNLCGDEVFLNWAVELGIVTPGSDDYHQLVIHDYPPLTPEQLAALWTDGYHYLQGGSDTAGKLLELFEQRTESPIREGISDSWTSIAKAGWYPDDEYGIPATCDAGIVTNGRHTYVVVIMTDIPSDLDRLARQTGRLFSARKVLR